MMETNYKITIPKPCHEDWNQMTPEETGRFCNSCAKSVVDFTNMKAPEIQEYFIKNKGQKVCGRFKTEQIDSIIIQIPRNILFSQIQFHKMFLLALLISMPGLVSCQNANGSKQKIDKVEVVDSVRNEHTVGKTKLKNTKEEKIEMTPERKARIERLKERREALVKKRQATKKASGTKTGDIAIVTSGIVSVEPYKGKPEVVDKNTVYMLATVEVKPTYPGGISKFYDYFKSNFKLAEQYKNITQRIIVSFIIDSDGSLTDVKVLRGINDTVDKEVLRVVETSPKWIPGKLKDENVKVSCSLPIKITAQ